MPAVKSHPNGTTAAGSWLPIDSGGGQSGTLHGALSKSIDLGDVITTLPRIMDNNAVSVCTLTMDSLPSTGVLVAAKLYLAYAINQPIDPGVSNTRTLQVTLSQGATTLHDSTDPEVAGVMQVLDLDLTPNDIQFDTVFSLDLSAGGKVSGKAAIQRTIYVYWAQVELIFLDAASLTTVPSPVNSKDIASVFCSNEGTTWGYNNKIFLPPVPTLLGIDLFNAEYKISGVFATKPVLAKKEGYFIICTKTAAYYLSYAQVLTVGMVLEINIFDNILSYTVQGGDDDASIALALGTLLKDNGYASEVTDSGLFISETVGFFSTVDNSFLLKVRAPLAKVKKDGKFDIITGAKPLSNWSVVRSVNSEPC